MKGPAHWRLAEKVTATKKETEKSSRKENKIFIKVIFSQEQLTFLKWQGKEEVHLPSHEYALVLRIFCSSFATVIQNDQPFEEPVCNEV